MRLPRSNTGRPDRRALVFATTLLLTGLTACSGPPPPPPPPAVGVIEIHTAPATVTAEYVAQTEAFNTAEIRPRVGGLLEKQAAVEGSRVKKGHVLFVIDQQQYIAAAAQARAAVAEAQAALEQSNRDLARVQPLAEVNAVSKQELDAVVARDAANRASVAAASAALKTAELNLDYTTVTSPIDGVVGRAQLRVGGLVTPNTTLLTTVYATDPMYVNFSISERRMLELQDRFGGMPNGNSSPATFKILLADGSEYPQPAKLNFVDAAVDQATGTLALRLEVPNPDQLLLDGQFARVIVTTEQLPDAIVVPQRAVQEMQGKTSVWIVDAEGKAQSRDVLMGARIAGDWLVREGLEAGDTVVVDGAQKLRPGTPVNAQPLATRAATPPTPAAQPAAAGAKP